MNKEPDNGGPAFPQAPIKWNDGNGDCVATGSAGMALRDWFAGMALQGLCSDEYIQRADCDVFSALSYKIADAMLAERNRKEVAK